MKLRQILQDKGQEVHATDPAETLGRVVHKLVGNNCGALVVLDDGRMVGIISERDILRACAELERPLEALVRDRMTTDLVTAAPDDDVEEVMGLLTWHRIRHLPVLEGEQLIGMISIGDVVKAQHDELSSENRLLKQYIQG